MMRVLQLVAIGLFLMVGAATVQAQNDALVGTWKLDTAKSKFDPGPDYCGGWRRREVYVRRSGCRRKTACL